MCHYHIKTLFLLVKVILVDIRLKLFNNKCMSEHILICITLKFCFLVVVE